MNELLLEKLDEFYKEVDNCNEIKEMIELKAKIYNNSKLKQLLEKYKNTNSKYSDDFIQLKKEIISNDLIQKYRLLENELYFITLEVNNKFKNLIDKKRCDNANN